MASTGLSFTGVRAAVLGAMFGLCGPGQARAETPQLRLQAISQESPDGCIGIPELDDRVEEEIKQLTGRVPHRSATAPVNPTLTPVESVQVFGGYIEPLDDGWRARLWLKDAEQPRVAVRDVYYRSLEILSAELPQDAAALITTPDWSRTASAAPQYCPAQGKSPYPEDACDPFLPPPSCGVPFDCTLKNQQPRCPTQPACGTAGKPACAPGPEQCRVRDWRLGTGIAALVVGGVGVSLGGMLQVTSNEGITPAAVTSYVVGGALVGTGAGLVTHWVLRAKTAPCKGKSH